jgi:pyruvate ferredoxin oxidoreductase beta subunit/2-oxoisovalerate ferredoxin oxidoreductase beta subunit
MAGKVAAMAVETKIFPLYEVEDGVRYRLTHQPRSLPVSRYLSMQGRYRHVTEEQVCFLQSEADWAWEDLLDRERRGRARVKGGQCAQSAPTAA